MALFQLLLMAIFLLLTRRTATLATRNIPWQHRLRLSAIALSTGFVAMLRATSDQARRLKPNRPLSENPVSQDLSNKALTNDFTIHCGHPISKMLKDGQSHIGCNSF